MSTATAQRAPVSARRAWASLAALSFGTFTFVTTESLPIGLLTSMSDDLHRSVSSIGLLVTGYAVVVVLVSVPLTHATRALPRRTVLAGTLAALVVMALVSAAAPSYQMLFLARLVTALAQALFWSVVASAVAYLFEADTRGRALSLLFAGTSLAPVLGVPAATWLGQQTSWRVAFVALSGLALATFAATVALLPRSSSADDALTEGRTPDSRRYLVVLGVTALGITGALALYTYVTPFLLEVSHFSRGSLAILLGLGGAAGVVGSFLTGAFLDGHPGRVIMTALGSQAAALALLYAFGDGKVIAIAMLMVVGGGMSAMAAGLSARGLEIAPGRTDIAGAGISSAYNVGIAGGSWVGGLVVAGATVRGTALTGALFVAAALALAASEGRIARRGAGALDARKPAP
ncbi:MAG: hypothetical protein JWM93_3885 [Frankiales bacterium]|nr:hypothetical protein [Frankiales bacterium]